MDSIWRYGECTMSTRRLKQLTWIGMITGTMGIWYSIFTIGFFTTLLWLLIATCILIIIIKLKEETRV